MAQLRAQDLPSEMGLHVLRRLTGWDLVAACRASAVWNGIASSEGMWRRACEYRWPHRFETAPLVRHDLDAGGAPPLLMPPWARLLDERGGRGGLGAAWLDDGAGWPGWPGRPGLEYTNGPAHPKLLPPPGPDSCAPPPKPRRRCRRSRCMRALALWRLRPPPSPPAQPRRRVARLLPGAGSLRGDEPRSPPLTPRRGADPARRHCAGDALVLTPGGFGGGGAAAGAPSGGKLRTRTLARGGGSDANAHAGASRQ
eukprot:scaffold27941_cov84-Isochrysis_galbana.AAC.2